MIAYYGPYNSLLGRSRFLGQDAAIVPAAPAPAPLPTPEPFGPAQAAQAPAPAPVPAQPAPKGWTVTIGGKAISGWTLVLSGAVIAGGIALVAFTKADIDRIYARKKT